MYLHPMNSKWVDSNYQIFKETATTPISPHPTPTLTEGPLGAQRRGRETRQRQKKATERHTEGH